MRSPTSPPSLVNLLFEMTASHVPVLLDETLELLDPRPGDVAVDCTFGGGGHARAIAERLGPDGLLVAIDRDPVAEERFAELAGDVPCRTRFVRSDFAGGLERLVAEGLHADVVLMDLGMSSMQVDTWQRGFSYAYDAPLDMRMDPDQGFDARELVNTWDERRLASVLREFGEERYSRQIARAIVRARPLETTHDLVEVIKRAVPAPARFAGGHPAKRSFQAIRIAVNAELEQLDRALPLAWALLARDGRFAGISFHSLEDRRVKRFLADRAKGCVCPPDLPVCACGRTAEAALLARGGVTPSADETAHNPRAASARLRAARKLTEEPR
jgi:16S rRNA (cytosine1402-N4)-methyltransferase